MQAPASDQQSDQQSDGITNQIFVKIIKKLAVWFRRFEIWNRVPSLLAKFLFFWCHVDSCKFLHDRSDYKFGWQLDSKGKKGGKVNLTKTTQSMKYTRMKKIYPQVFHLLSQFFQTSRHDQVRLPFIEYKEWRIIIIIFYTDVSNISVNPVHWNITASNTILVFEK